MRYCKRCLYHENHPLGIIIDDDGICSGCLVHEEKITLDWDKRFEKLKNLVNGFKNQDAQSYDCIVPVTGAKDSYYTLHIVKKILGLNPLLVRYNPHFNSKIGHRNYAYLKTIFDVDALDMVSQPQKVKKITKVTLDKFKSIHWHIVAGNSVFPVQIAVRYKIPLIIWGAHQGVEQVGMYSHEDEVEMSRKYRKEHDLMGYEAEDLVGVDNLTKNDLLQYFYPDSKEIEKVGVRGIYLSNYIAWDSKKQHELMIKLYGYKTQEQNRTFDTYNTIDTLHYADTHDYIKFRKCSYTLATDHACREIRWGRLSKEDALKLTKYYQEQPLKYLPQLASYFDISVDILKEKIGYKKLEQTILYDDIKDILDKLNFIEDKKIDIDEDMDLLQRGFED